MHVSANGRLTRTVLSQHEKGVTEKISKPIELQKGVGHRLQGGEHEFTFSAYTANPRNDCNDTFLFNYFVLFQINEVT